MIVTMVLTYDFNDIICSEYEKTRRSRSVLSAFFLLKCLIKLDELTFFMHFYTINMKTAVFVHVSGMKIKIMVPMIYLRYITG